MRFRTRTWWLACLLCLAVGVVLWRRADGPAARENAARAAQPAAKLAAKANAIPLTVAPSQPHALLPSAFTSAVTNAASAPVNPFPLRVTNTPKTVGQLANDPHALLLENALIDTASGRTLDIPQDLRAGEEPGAYIVQAVGVVDQSFRAALTGAGAEIVSYIPNNAYLVTATATAARGLRQNSRVQFVQPYEPQFKLKMDALKAAVAREPVPANSAVQMLTFPGREDSTVAALGNLGAQVLAREQSGLGTILTVRPDQASLASLAQLQGVHTLQFVKPRKSANDLTRVRLGITTNTLTGATNNYLGLTGSNVCVNVNDFGFDATHPDLSPRIIQDPSNVTLTDTDGHGTHVAGIIISSGGKSSTVTNASGSVVGADFRGKAPSATIFGMTIQDELKHTDTYLQENAASSTNRPYISNNSWGIPGENDYDLTAASYDAAVRDALPGVTGSQPLVYVFSAGNSGFGNTGGNGGEPGSLVSPGTAKNVITVGASESPRNITNLVTPPNGSPQQIFRGESDSTNQVAYYSSRGNVGIGIEGDFGRFKPDVIAPGSWIVSTRSSTWDAAAYYSPFDVVDFRFRGQTINPTNQLSYLFAPPANTVQLTFEVRSNSFSLSPFSLPVTAVQGTTTVGGAGNSITANFPPFATSQFMFVNVTNGLRQTNYFDVFGTLTLSNDFGTNYFIVRSNLDNGLGPWYRYESGTSMSAPAVSGQLALMQEYFEKYTGSRPSPALLKALLINGARSLSSQYDFQVRSIVNYQGWGLVNLPNSLPPTLSNYVTAVSGGVLAFDQNSTNALATGQSATRTIALTNAARNQPLRFTLVWTDPPGDPSAAIKLVNDLDLIVTNLDNGDVYLGNDFQSGNINTLPWDTNGAPNPDSINNVENIYLSSSQRSLGTNYAVTVVGRRVNVNAVTAHTNDYVQDYALVITSGNGTVTNALRLTGAASNVNVTVTQPLVTPLTGVFSNGVALFNQHVGANTPLLGTTNGMTNQWHFYVVTNDTTYTNVAFLTFAPPELSVPRIGTRVPPNQLTNATRPEADIDLYVSTNPGLTNLDPVAVATADVSQTRPGSEFVVYSNSVQNTVYYIGVKSEDHMGAEYGFFGVASELPFDETDANGNHIIRGTPAIAPIPDGTPGQPGAAVVFGIATSSYKARRVIVTNNIVHELMGDLYGDLQHSRYHVALNNHSFGDAPPEQIQQFVYDDNAEGDIPGARKTDGPGTLRNFVGQQSAGVWQLSMIDNAATHIGTNYNFSLYIEPENETNDYTGSIQPGGTFYVTFDVPPTATNATFLVSGISQNVDMWISRGHFPDEFTHDFSANFNPPGGSISVDRFSTPPLSPGTYYVAVHNNGNSVTTVRVRMTLGLDINAAQTLDFTSTGVKALLDDAVTNGVITVSGDATTNHVYSVEAGVRIDHPRESDLALTLVSPHGTRVLLAENRGGSDTNGYGRTAFTTNSFPRTAAGTAAEDVNIIDTGATSGTLQIDYNFYRVPDHLTVIYEGNVIFDITTNNPPVDPNASNPGTNTIPGSFSIPYGPGASTALTIIINQGGSTNQTAWTYTAYTFNSDQLYFNFTEDTAKAALPMKFYPPPFRGSDPTNVFSSSFEGATLGTYTAPATVDGWSVTTNSVTVLTNPAAFAGVKSLGLSQGTISRTVTTTPGHKYGLSYNYRTSSGTNPLAWWPGQSNSTDIISGVNGTVIGAMTYTQAVVGLGFNFPGTNAYINVPVSTTPALQTITNRLTLEGWIKYEPTVGGTNFVVATKGVDAESAQDWTLSVNANHLRPHVFSGGSWNLFNCSTLLQTGVWYHVAMVYNGTTLQGFVNGVPDGSAAATGTIRVTTNSMRIGAYSPVNGTASKAYFPGVIDDLAVYNRALSTNEIAAIYAAGAAGKCGLAVPPPICGGSVADVTVVGVTNETITATNTSWLSHATQFTAVQTNATLQFQGLSAGLMLDNINFIDLGYEPYAFPEDSLNNYKGEVAQGDWKLEIWDKRAGAFLNTSALLAWKLSLILDNTVPQVNTNVAPASPTFNLTPTNMTIDELTTLVVTNAATPAFPTNTLTYSLLNPPTGAVIDANTGVITWTPDETQGYGTWNLTTVVTDNQTPIAGRATNQFLVYVNEVNLPPVLPNVPATNYFVPPGTFTLVDTATDPDFPANLLTYTLLDGPTNAIVSGTGIVSWTPDTNQVPSTNLFTVVVTDDSPNAVNAQHLSATNSFYVVVLSSGTNASTYSFMHYNVKGNGATDWTTNAPQVQAIGREIRYLQPDIIAFNEIPAAHTNEMSNWALDFLTGYQVVVSPGSDGFICSAIASRFPITRSASWLDGADLTPFGYAGTFTRDLFEAQISVPGFTRPVHVFTTHLKSSISGYADAAAKRAAEAAAITNFLATTFFTAYPSNYYTLSGDLNEGNTNTLAIQQLVSTPTGLRLTDPINPYSGSINTDPSTAPSSRIDYILPCGPLYSNIVASQVFRTDLLSPTPPALNADDQTVASDHLPVLMLFRDPAAVGYNLPPVFIAAPPGRSILAGSQFTLTNLAVDFNIPAQTLTYALDNPPVGMVIDPATGVITWTPTTADAGLHVISTVVTDNGVPPLSTTNFFNLNVVDLSSIATNIVAFPGAEGAGAYALGGRGGDVYHVTSLNDDGNGTLRLGLRSPFRTIVFDVSGTINLASDLKITRSHITIAGQTAPGDGITLRGRLTSIEGVSNVVIRYIRCRPGDINCPGFQDDAFHFTRVTNCIADHLSASWSIDEALSCTQSKNVTVQWSMISDSLNNSCHVKGAHGYGSLIRYGDGKISYHHNLYADNNSRNPRLGDNLTLDFVNNVIYNWGELPGYSGDYTNDLADNPAGFTNFLNYVGNYAIAGTNSTQTVNAFIGFTTNTWIYQSANLIDSDRTGSLNGTDTGFSMIGGSYTPSGVPFALPAPAVTTDPAPTAYERVLAFVGASATRDSVDNQVISKVLNQSGVIIDSQTAVGGWPVLNSTAAPADTDRDGLPNYWENIIGLQANNAADSLVDSGTGYTYLENYLNWLAAPHAIMSSGSFVDVDLKLIAGNTGLQVFTVGGGSNGVVTLRADGRTARFAPTNGFTGFGSFTFTVTNVVTGVGFGPVAVSVLVLTPPTANTPPVFNATPADRTIDPLAAVSVANPATDNDLPAQTLTYTLLVAPTNATINSASGTLAWTPTMNQAGTTNLVTTVVTDDGLPNLSTNNTYTLIVRPATPILGVSNTSTNVTLTWYGLTNLSFNVQVATNLALPMTWFTFSNVITSTDGTFTFTDDGTQAGGLTPPRYYRYILLP